MLTTEQTKIVADGTVLLQEGKPNQEAYMIVKGKVAVTKLSDEKKDILLAELTEGEVFGEMSLLEDIECNASVKSIGQVELLVFNKKNFLNNMKQDEQALQTVMGKLFKRIRTMNKQVVHLETQILNFETPASDKLVIKALTAPAKHAIYDMNSLIIDESPFQIGRRSKRQSKTSWFSPNKVRNHINIRDIPPYVISREHCRIDKKKSGVFITDLDSRLGTWVNGYRIGRNSEKSIQLKIGSNRISLGDKKSNFSFEVYVP